MCTPKDDIYIHPDQFKNFTKLLAKEMDQGLFNALTNNKGSEDVNIVYGQKEINGNN